MKQKCQNFFGTKKLESLKRLEYWNGFIICKPTHMSPYRRDHPDATLFTKSLRNTLGMEPPSNLERFCDDYSLQARVDGGRECHCKGFLYFIRYDGIPEWHIPMVSI